MNTDSVFIIAMTILIILCFGEPDILDGLIAMANSGVVK